MDWEEACRILGVETTASDAEIRDQWLYKAQLLHPDKTLGQHESIRKRATDEFILVKQAYEFLSELDVTPLTLGVETPGGISTPVIEQDTRIPTSKSFIVSTIVDDQPSIEIHVLQGERLMATDNRTLGWFIIDGILPAPRGMPQVEVTFDIDANGILSIKARDKGTGREQKVTITTTSGVSKNEIEKMRRDAELNS